MSVNVSVTSILLNNLTQGAVYTAKIMAHTQAGGGPYSTAVTLSHSVVGPSSYPTASPSQIGFMLLLAVTVVVLIIAFAATVYLKHRQRLTKEVGHLSSKCFKSHIPCNSQVLTNNWQTHFNNYFFLIYLLFLVPILYQNYSM